MSENLKVENRWKEIEPVSFILRGRIATQTNREHELEVV